MNDSTDRQKMQIPKKFLIFTYIIANRLAPAVARGQAAGIAIEKKRLPAPTPEMTAQFQALIEAGKPLTMDSATEALAHPTPASVALPPAATRSMRPAELAPSPGA